MKQITCIVTNSEGMHTRHAGLLVKTAKSYDDTVITITKDGDTVKAGQLMKLIGLGIKQGDEIIVTAEGPNEDAAIAEMETFFPGSPCSDTAGKIIGGWIFCPACGQKTCLRVRPDTELKNFPLICPKCKQENLIDMENMNLSVINKPDAVIQS